MKLNLVSFLLPILTVCILAGCTGQSSDQYLAKAVEYRENGENQAAILELKNAIRQEPKNSLLRFELGKTYMLVHEFESAEKELNKSLEMGFDANQILPLLSEAYQRTRADVALSQLDLYNNNLSPTAQLEVGYRKVIAMVDLEQRSEAYELIDQLLKIDANSVYKDLIALLPDFIKGDYVSALDSAISARKRSPLNSDVLLLTARLYGLNADNKNAIDTYKAYLKTEPEDLEVKFVLASLLVQQRDAEQATPIIDDLLALNDQSPYLNKLKSIAKIAEEDYASALVYSEKAINSGTLDPLLRLVAGFSAYKTGKYDTAVSHLTLIADTLPDNHPILRLLAASQVNSSASSQVKDVIDRIEPLSDGDVTLFTNAAVKLAKSDDETAAKSVIERAEPIVRTEDLEHFGIVKLSMENLTSLMKVSQEVEQYQLTDADKVLASAYLVAGKLEEASALADTWLTKNNNDVYGLSVKSQVAYTRGDIAQASDYANRILDIQSTNPDANVILGQIAFNKGERIAALNYAKTAITSQKDNQKAWRLLFDADVDENNKQTYLDELTRYVNDNPTKTPIRLFTADIALELDRTKTALDVLAPIKFSAGTPNHVWGLKGSVLLFAGELGEAENHYTAWLKTYPKQEKAALGLITVLNANREYGKALKTASDFLAVENNVDVQMAQAHFFALTKQTEKAIQAYKLIPSSQLENPFVRGIKARIGFQEQRYTEVLDDAKSAYQQTDNYDNLLLLVNLLNATDKRAMAIDHIESHIKTNPHDVLPKMLLAEYYFVEQPDKSLGIYLDALPSDENNTIALNNIAYLFGQKGDLDNAERYAIRAFELLPSNPGIADTYAQVLIAKKDIEGAVKIYDSVLSKSDAPEFIKLNYIESMLIAGQQEMARRRLKDMKFLRPESFLTLERLSKEYEFRLK